MFQDMVTRITFFRCPLPFWGCSQQAAAPKTAQARVTLRLPVSFVVIQSLLPPTHRRPVGICVEIDLGRQRGRGGGKRVARGHSGRRWADHFPR